MGNYSIAVLPGDGIGPEVIEQAVRVLQNIGKRYRHTFNLQHAMVGVAAIEAEGDAISEATMQLCQQSDAVLFGAYLAQSAAYLASRDQIRRSNQKAPSFACVKSWRSLPICVPYDHSMPCLMLPLSNLKSCKELTYW